MLELVLEFYCCTKVYNAQPCNVTLYQRKDASKFLSKFRFRSVSTFLSNTAATFLFRVLLLFLCRNVKLCQVVELELEDLLITEKTTLCKKIWKCQTETESRLDASFLTKKYEDKQITLKTWKLFL